MKVRKSGKIVRQLRWNEFIKMNLLNDKLLQRVISYKTKLRMNLFGANKMVQKVMIEYSFPMLCTWSLLLFQMTCFEPVFFMRDDGILKKCLFVRILVFLVLDLPGPGLPRIGL
jgi:hypothetical protein